MDPLAAETFGAAERIVKPRTREYARRPVIALHRYRDDGGNLHAEYLSETGEVGTFDELVLTLRDSAPTLFVTENSADVLGDFDICFADRYASDWQWKVTNGENDIVAPGGKRVGTRVTTIVHWFGFKKKSGFHKMLDPVVMYARPLDTIWPSDESHIVRLLRWGIAIRDFCDENGMEVRPTLGSISTQFLTDPRFYPDARRKVPQATNDAVRAQQGNFYHLSVIPEPEQTYNAYYLDQRRAHHYHARTVQFPDADSLYAMGDFTNLEWFGFTDSFDSFHGLYCLDLSVPLQRVSPFIRAWLHYNDKSEPLLEKRFVFSNEIPFLLDKGFRVQGIRAAWGSRHVDAGLALYSTWAETQLDRHDDPAWLKPLLLSTYGTLASRPKILEQLFKIASKGELVTLPVGRNKLTGMYLQGKHKLEPRTANVLHRGMIDAAQRIESVAYADFLDSRGYRVLSINADAVMVEVNDDREPPLLIDPWKLKGILTHYQPVNDQGFTSDQLTKLPGVPGISRDLAKFRQRTPGRAPRVINMYQGMSGRLIRVDQFTKKEVQHGDVR